jgi:hypothetical protein
MMKNDESVSAAGSEQVKILAGPWSTPPLSTEERLHRIEVLGQKIADYVRFMGQVFSHNGASAESKDRAVNAFYDRLVVVEKQLSRIKENFRLE